MYRTHFCHPHKFCAIAKSTLLRLSCHQVLRHERVCFRMLYSHVARYLTDRASCVEVMRRPLNVDDIISPMITVQNYSPWWYMCWLWGVYELVVLYAYGKWRLWAICIHAHNTGMQSIHVWMRSTLNNADSRVCTSRAGATCGSLLPELSACEFNQVSWLFRAHTRYQSYILSSFGYSTSLNITRQ